MKRFTTEAILSPGEQRLKQEVFTHLDSRPDYVTVLENVLKAGFYPAGDIRTEIVLRWIKEWKAQRNMEASS